ncbi:hypothetical protein P20652_1849 [Pseudoalteromonas sp. BSi20652]|uniref:glycosyltransferase n=1 Tax=Pseudoalteromonas sp. BSi20652 TaxID=388384 RepID=UPI0002318BA6|nr:glycosyltransferase [Pseudoalteromonas sp. BSi20652]GAA59985.1 hypothetical protein P20652_1849 [Pseudoalteromonas sp. BSi20652]
MNPLVHYLLHGLNEGRKAVALSIIPSSQPAGNNLNITDVSKVQLSIIIPVYNALEEVKSCIDSVIKNTPLSKNINVIVINDCSPDKNIKPMLSAYKNIPNIVIKNNLTNLGYTRNVNKGAKLAKNRDIILLNSDTVVSPNWIRNLIIAAYSKNDIGTVTAVSNNAGAFSVPKSGTNDIPEHLDIDAIARIVKNSDGGYIDVPTGNGFCLYIKRELIDDIGSFDYKKFPRGYGEENDFCMRAVDNGWINIVDTKTYIYHQRSASFKDSKYQLMEDGITQVKKDFPEYSGAIKAIGGSVLFKKARAKIQEDLDKLTKSNVISKPKIMFVISTRTGGTPQTNLDLMRQLSEIYDCYALASNSTNVEILKAGPSGYESIESHTLAQPVKYSTHRSGEYESLVRHLLFKYNIDLLHIRHIAWHSLMLPKIAKELLIPVVKSFHDFYAICPSVNLVDGGGVYHPNGVSEESPNPLWKDETVTPMSPVMLERWQQRMDKSLLVCDHFITTCHSAKNILLSKLDLISQKDSFTVIPHGRDFDSFIAPIDYSTIDGKLKVLVPGNIALAKGSELIKQVKTLDKDNLIEFHIIGTCTDDLLPFVTYHGRYERSQFQKLVSEIQPHISAVFSIWPETYCHTLTESWATGIPVIGVAYGAVEERINRHKAGWLIENNAEECFAQLLAIKNSTEVLKEKQNAVIQWQQGYGAQNTVSNMTGNYISIYQSILTPSAQQTNRKLGFVMKGYFPEVPPTAYVRLVDWKEEFEKSSGLEVEFTGWDTILTSELSKFEALVIQRDAIPSYAVDWCINTLKEYNVPYTFEMDDNLLEVPAAVDPAGVYSEYKPYLIKLLSGAGEVHVTNDALSDVCKNYNQNIVIRPNKVFPNRWKDCPVDERIDLKLEDSDLNLLYFGSKTHQEDLNFLIEVVSLARESGKNIQLYVVGCGDSLPKFDYIHRLTPPSSRYDVFVDWLIKIAHQFDVGVAPLINEEFAVTKSYIKCLELDALKLPVICSNILPYSALRGELKYQHIKFLNNDTESWANEICRLSSKK